jgi:chorismate-pyruvate lyase
MALTKQTIIDKIETVKILDHYVLQIREENQVLEDEKRISGTYHRYVLLPDHDVSKITDATIKAQFEAVMTDEVKANYQKFWESEKLKTP